MKNKIANLTNLVVGDKMEDMMLLVSAASTKMTSGAIPKPYLNVILSDNSGRLSLKFWDYSGSAPEVGSIVQASFTVDAYEGNLQGKLSKLNVIPIEMISSDELRNLVPSAPEDSENMFRDICELADNINDEDYKKIVMSFLDENKDALLICPGGKKMHHARIGGLLQHMLAVTITSMAIAETYKGKIDMPLLICAAIIHDAKKIKEFLLASTGLVRDYSEEGKLLGHVFMGAEYVGELCKKLNIADNKRYLLEHMILSHHGKLEWGSPVVPLIPEAIILSTADNLDAEMDRIISAKNT